MQSKLVNIFREKAAPVIITLTLFFPLQVCNCKSLPAWLLIWRILEHWQIQNNSIHNFLSRKSHWCLMDRRISSLLTSPSKYGRCSKAENSKEITWPWLWPAASVGIPLFSCIGIDYCFQLHDFALEFKLSALEKLYTRELCLSCYSCLNMIYFIFVLYFA